MIQLIDVSKTFKTDKTNVHAVKDVNLTINDGEIFGVIGYSGAGKSTLVRCINLLERPTKGQVLIDGVDLLHLKEKELRLHRQKIGMIFQQFNLLASRTVLENVAFPLRYRGISKEKITEKVLSLLDLVGIADKSSAYPSQLSGGQKQRVAIARALATDPSILLCDEATSALDPQTIKSILNLLKEVNKKLGITIVIITHEMNVIKEICNRVAVMEDGKVVELNDVISVFSNPQAQITKDFINSTSTLSRIDELIKEKSDLVELDEDEGIWRLDFYGSETKESIISDISKKYNINPSVIFANVEVISDTVLGSIIIRLRISEKVEKDVIQYLKDKQIRVEVIKNARVVRKVYSEPA
ncbi:ATP-binding cassette domain-containing protein [Tissierella sp. Yu-01]|uniref:methionine ABC transporter ATP-binding protein n=1 Tax=Tissierella sp. Yu-01 TaxID=3035694 RepID=UPI00240D90C7|nr:ATP-binding cassette domain-containing protein [Tissierella sp. Yu-01]WFA09273.1 ATP-binding cassette domain-containing protein [Tissierella sp. Yu-01]